MFIRVFFVFFLCKFKQMVYKPNDVHVGKKEAMENGCVLVYI